MPKGFKKVQPGDILDAFPYELYNGMIDVVEWWQGTRLRDTAPKSQASDGPRQIVRIKNGSGANRPKGTILGVDTSALYDLSVTGERDKAEYEPVLVGVKPEFPLHIGRFAVTLDNITDGNAGRAVLSGLAVVKLDVIHTDHKYADVGHEVYTKLTTREFGGAEIIKKESSGTGDKWALVRLGQLHLPDIKGKLDTDEVLESGASAEMTVWEMQSNGSYSTTGRTATVWGNFLESGKQLESPAFIWTRPQRESGLLELLQSQPCASEP